MGDGTEFDDALLGLRGFRVLAVTEDGDELLVGIETIRRVAGWSPHHCSGRTGSARPPNLANSLAGEHASIGRVSDTRRDVPPARGHGCRSATSLSGQRLGQGTPFVEDIADPRDDVVRTHRVEQRRAVVTAFESQAGA